MSKPGPQCTVCKHDDRSRIELFLARRVPLSVIGARFNFSISSLSRHRTNHMPAALKAALSFDRPQTDLDLEKLRQNESEKFLQNLVAHRGHLWGLINFVEDAGDYRGAATLHGLIIKLWKVEGELIGELNQAARYVTNNVLIAPVYVSLRDNLIVALRPYPEASQAVAKVLHKVEVQALEDGRDAA